MKTWPRYYRVWLVFTWFYWAILGCIGFYWILLGFTGFYWVLLGFTGFYWVLLELTNFFSNLQYLAGSIGIRDPKKSFLYYPNYFFQILLGFTFERDAKLVVSASAEFKDVELSHFVLFHRVLPCFTEFRHSTGLANVGSRFHSNGFALGSNFRPLIRATRQPSVAGPLRDKRAFVWKGKGPGCFSFRKKIFKLFEIVFFFQDIKPSRPMPIYVWEVRRR